MPGKDKGEELFQQGIKSRPLGVGTQKRLFT